MKADKRNYYREKLLAIRERISGEVNYVVEALQEDVNVNEDISSAPVHLADVAGEAVDADVEILHTTRNMLDEVNAALVRLDEGTFGKCTECGAAISEERLGAIPYTPYCVRCAKSSEQPAAGATEERR
jgi:RNA polymerase-binding protein DksA